MEHRRFARTGTSGNDEQQIVRQASDIVTIKGMPLAVVHPPKPRWYFIPVRVLLITFLLTLLSFAISLLLGILGMVIVGRARGVHPDMALAYRHFALPAAAAVAAVVLVSATFMEVRHYLQTKALAGIVRATAKIL
jgi:hypothetical protein